MSTPNADYACEGSCHEDCGPIVVVSDDGQHAHENADGRCWHDNDDIPETFTEDDLRRIVAANPLAHIDRSEAEK